MQCFGSGMIYSGSRSRQNFRLLLRIQPSLIKYIYKKKKNLKSIKKKNLTSIFHAFSVSYYSPTVQKVQNSQCYLSAITLFAGSGSGTIITDPDPGKSSESATLPKCSFSTFLTLSVQRLF